MSRRTSLTSISLIFAAFIALGVICSGCSESKAVDATATPTWVLRLPEGARYGAWSPDGKLFALPAHDRIELISTDGSLARKIRVPGVDNSGLSCECRLAWTEGGRQIHIVTRPRPKARAAIATVNADGTHLKERFLNLHITDAAWGRFAWPLVLKPGHSTVRPGRPNSERSQLLRLGSLEAQLTPILEKRGYISNLAFPPDGSEIAFSVGGRQGREALWTVSGTGDGPRLVLAGVLEPSLSWSPDGHALAVSALSDGGRSAELKLVSTTSGRAKLLAQGPIALEPAAWTPNGRWVAFAATNGDVEEIRPDGSGQRRLFGFPGEEVAGLSWSPDGRHLALTTHPVTDTG